MAVSSSSALRVALAQVASSLDPEENRAALPALAERASGTDLVVLPEVFARDFGPPDDRLGPYAESLDGPFVAALTAAARSQGGTWVAGMLEHGDDPERPYNTLVVVDRDGLRASYRKMHLYDSFGFLESERMTAGPATPTLVEVGGLTVGLMTCYDLRFPELGRALSRAGAELLVVPAAWVVGPRKVAHWRTLLAARAIENVAYVAGACQPGPRYTGHSVVLDPWGEPVATAEDGDTMLTAYVDAATVADARAENPSLDNRRDDVPWDAPVHVTAREPRG